MNWAGVKHKQVPNIIEKLYSYEGDDEQSSEYDFLLYTIYIWGWSEQGGHKTQEYFVYRSEHSYNREAIELSIAIVNRRRSEDRNTTGFMTTLFAQHPVKNILQKGQR